MFWNHTRKKSQLYRQEKPGGCAHNHFSQTGYSSLLLILQNKFYLIWPNKFDCLVGCLKLQRPWRYTTLWRQKFWLLSPLKSAQPACPIRYTQFTKPVRHPEACFELTFPVGSITQSNSYLLWCRRDSEVVRKDVSWRRLLLPQWLTQPLLPAFTRPQERQLSGFLLLLHRNMFLKHSPADPLQGRGSCMFSYCEAYKCMFPEMCMRSVPEMRNVLPLQPGFTSHNSWASTVIAHTQWAQ